MNESYPVKVIFEFEALDDGNTMLSISEEGWKTDADGLKGSHDNCGGWTHMAMCLKAWIEHGIDLRYTGCQQYALTCYTVDRATRGNCHAYSSRLSDRWRCRRRPALHGRNGRSKSTPISIHRLPCPTKMRSFLLRERT